jgi:hypothetical protein
MFDEEEGGFFSRTIGKMRRTKRGCETLRKQLLH